jgi:hypothetical protein
MHFNLPHTIATVFLLLQLLFAPKDTHAWLFQAGGISEASTTTTTTAATSRLQMIKPGARESESQLLVALDNAGFSIFDSAVDLGFYIWKPTGECRSLETVVDPQEILASIDPNKLPDPMIEVSTLNSEITFPFYFSLRNRPQLVKNTYPHAQHSVASLYVASKERGLDLDTLDFCLGGSTLEILATQRIPNGEKHLVALLPGSSTRTVVVAKHKEYLQDYADFGFQFERLVVGKPITALHDTKNNLEHLQVLEVSARHNHRHGGSGGGDSARYKILISGNADGVDTNGNPVEVKTNKPKYWGTKVMFQMISGASLTMCFGQNSYERNGSERVRFLSKIQLLSLEEVAAKALKHQSITRLETNICNGLETLKKAATNNELASGQVYEIGFSELYGLQLQPSTESIYALFPREQVVDALLKVQ